jgi:hypothetical protein
VVASGIDSTFENEVWFHRTYPPEALMWGHRLREHIEVDPVKGLVIRHDLFHKAVPDHE